jgi:hypothetical protein
LAGAGNVDFGALLAVTALCLQGLLRPTTDELLPLIVGRSVHTQLYNLAGHMTASSSWAAQAQGHLLAMINRERAVQLFRGILGPSTRRPGLPFIEGILCF